MPVNMPWTAYTASEIDFEVIIYLGAIVSFCAAQDAINVSSTFECDGKTVVFKLYHKSVEAYQESINFPSTCKEILVFLRNIRLQLDRFFIYDENKWYASLVDKIIAYEQELYSIIDGRQLDEFVQNILGKEYTTRPELIEKLKELMQDTSL